MNINGHINTQTNQKTIKTIDNSKSQINENVKMIQKKAFSLDDVYQKGLDRLSAHYGIDIRKIE